MGDRRIEARLLCADMVEVTWESASGEAQQATALLEDISPSGACLHLEVDVRVGSLIRWRSPKQEFLGVVRHCEYQEIGYFVGVEFAPGSRWSRRSYEPEHLLDVQGLMK
jgi:hypothetical protein